MHLSFRTAVLWVLLSAFFISGSATIGLTYYRYIKKQRLQQSEYNIVAIVQTTPDQERLKTVFLAELMHLSYDHPTNLFRFNTKEAQRILMSTALISAVKVKKILPGTIYVDYTMRKPIAYLSDFTNTVIDHEGVTFPFTPFFTPKRLPEVYLGMSQESLTWGKAIRNVQCKFALYLIDLITNQCCSKDSQLIRVDVSKSLADSYGQKQVIIILEDQINREGTQLIMPQILRLSVDHYRQELANYLALRPILHKQYTPSEGNSRLSPITIDLRISNLAFIGH